MSDNNTDTQPTTPTGRTILHLTDKSTIQLKGDLVDEIGDCIAQGRNPIFNDPNGDRVLVNPAHIVTARYAADDHEEQEHTDV